MKLNDIVVKKARRGLEAAAHWAISNQIRHGWPKWNANAGRFPYHVHLPTQDHFFSTAWNTSRTAQGLLSAWKVLGKKECLESAERALAYVKSLQYFAPEKPEWHGAFYEETPQGYHYADRDGVEACQAFMAHYFATHDRVSLLRVRAYLDWMMRQVQKVGWKKLSWCMKAAIIPLVQYAAVTREKVFITRGVIPAAECVLDLLAPDGALRLPESSKGHHTLPDDHCTLVNDDGMVVALLCAWRATRKRKYLDAAVAHGEWWLDRGDDLPENYAMPLVVMISMTDLVRATKDRRFVEYIHARADHFFSLQIVRDERPLLSGAFLGEDMAVNYRKNAAPGDFSSLRSTSYGLIALAKLAARKSSEWGPSYSAFGF